MYLQVLQNPDNRQLRELLARTSPDVVMPLNGSGPLSQAVILTLIHRLGAIVGETSPVEEAFKSSLWWLHRCATVINTRVSVLSIQMLPIV